MVRSCILCILTCIRGMDGRGWGWVANGYSRVGWEVGDGLPGLVSRVCGENNNDWQQRLQQWCSGWNSCVWNRM